MNHRVIFDRILVRRDPESDEEQVVLTPHDVKKLPRTGVILCIGPDVKYAKEDDHITFNEYAGYYVHTSQDLMESDLISMREDEILTIVEPTEIEESG